MDKLGIGRKMERLAMKRWEWYGFKTWQAPRSRYKSGDGQDIFNLFDFIAAKPLCPVNLVQVKRYRKDELEAAQDAIEAFARDYSIPAAYFLVSWQKCAKGLLMRSWEYGVNGLWYECGQWTETP